MFNRTKWKMLQLFADGGASGAAGGDGGAASETGDNSADAGQQRLLELGVPKDKIRKTRAKQASTLPEGAYRTQQQMIQPKQQAAAAETTDAQTEQNTPTRMSWEEIMKDPEYNQEMQKVVKSRLKDADANKAILDTSPETACALTTDRFQPKFPTLWEEKIIAMPSAGPLATSIMCRWRTRREPGTCLRMT